MPSENIVIRRCRTTGGHCGIVLGNEVSGDCRNVVVEDCTTDSPKLVRAPRFKSNPRRGGVIEKIFLRRIAVGRVGRALVQLQLDYDQGTGPQTPVAQRGGRGNEDRCHPPGAAYPWDAGGAD